MTWKGPAVDKLVAQKVHMTYVKAAEDLDLAPVFTAASALMTSAMLHALISRRISLSYSCLWLPFDGGSPKLANQLR